MVRSISSPWPLTVALTRPPPDVPVTSASASACWALMSCSCICCAAANSCCISIWGSTSPSYAEPTTSLARFSRYGAALALELSDHLAAQLALDEVHAGQLATLDDLVIRRRLVGGQVVGRQVVGWQVVVRLVGEPGEFRRDELRWRRGGVPASRRRRAAAGGGAARALTGPGGGPAVGASHPLDRHIQAEAAAQHLLEDGLVAARVEALHVPFPREPQGEDPVLQRE